MFRRGLVKGKLQVGGGDRKTNEPDYEEVGPPTHLRKVPDAPKDGQNCDLCGSAPAAVRCDRCGSQAFCLSCDDMYHRHPRRSTHARKAVDSRPPAGGGIRPPLPPKGESQGGVPPPQPPPRKNKRAGFLSSSAFSKKEQSAGNETNNNSNSGGRTIMGSLKRFMGARPLPPTPLHNTCSGKNEAITALPSKASIRATTSPSLPNLSDHIDEEIRMGLPQSVLDLNTTVNSNNNSISTPVTPASAHAQYPPLQPKTLQPSPHTHSLGRKFSLQQLPQSFDDKRTSMVDPTAGGAPWEGETAKPPPRTRSHSVSDDQWAQMLAAETNTTTNTQSLGAPSGPTCPPGHVPADMSAFAGAATRRGYNSINNSGRSGGGTLGRGMVSSASVCDLNSLAQQQQQQQPLHGFSNAAGSFQQLNMMGYGGGMMWGAPCDLCQAPPMFTGHPGISGMKRTASNLSMNLSSVGSDMSGYPWAPPPHIHHHMPMYPGYYPGYHPHMAPPPMGTPMGLNMSIPDSMHTFGKVPSSPAPSVRSSSHRSHKSAKSRSFNAGDASGRRSRNRKAKRSEESEESRSTSVSEDEDDIDDRESKSGHGGVSSLAWQCDHCTFINSGGARTCGMCSKTVGGSGRSSRRGSERRRSERRRDRRTDQEDNERDVSDYDNDGGVVKSNFSFNIKDSKREARNKVSGSNKSKSKKKSRRRDGSESQSESGSEGEEEEQLERHMRDLRVSSSSRRRGSDHDGGNNKDRDRERTSRKKEGSVGRFKNRGKSHSERSRTPGRQTPRRSSPADDQASRGDSSDRSLPEDARTSRTLSADRNGHPNSQEGTLVDTFVSEATVKSGKKSKSDSSEHKSKSKGSKAPSPAVSVADEEPVHEQVLQAPVLDAKGNGEKSRSPSPRLEIRKSKSPALSQRTSRGEVDDPSFANTLDDIATMGTNEVADQDLSSHYLDDRPHSTDIQVMQNDDVPVVNYIRPVTPEEQAVDEPQTIVIEAPPDRRADFNNIEVKEEAVLMAPEDVGHVDNKIPAHEPLYEPSYETVGQPVEIEAQELAQGKTIINSNDTDREQDNYHTATTGNTAEEMKVEEKQQEIVADEEILQEVNAKQGSPMDFRGEMARSASSGSSLGLNSLPPDRQYTPLSFSSSDAQFYSPPDSPDISLSEQLQDKPPPGFTQTVVAREEEYLVTALETMRQTFEDLKSSRETIRSSMEQLPYSEEAPVSVGEAEGDAPRERSKSAESVTSVATSPAESVPRTTFPNGATASARAAASLTDAYESLSYQDALSSSGAGDPEHSASDKAARAAGQQAQDDAQAASSLADLLKEVERQRRSLEQPETQVNEKYLTVEEIITRRRQEAMRKQGLQLVQVLRDAEDAGYASEDVSIALTHCGDKNPLEWLRENWRHMVDTVSTLATNYGQERRVNDIGAITAGEARAALRLHKGNIWAAVTECVEQRQNKFDNIYARGRFKREAVVKALENHEGDADAAFLDLNKSQLQPFMMKIWGALKGETKQVPKTDPVALPQKEVQASPPPPLPTPAPASVPRPAQDDVLQPPTLVDASTDTGHANQGESLENGEEEEREGEEEEGEEVEATGNLQETQPLQFVRKEEPVEEPAEAAEADPARVRDSVLLLPLDEPGMAQTRTGPVTVQKASVIVGKAIAKAMARETSVRESLSRSVTPEVQEAPIATPEASEGEEEITIPGTTSDSDEEDHLRTLDTILEEEEISEMTESGRVMSRPASKRASSRADVSEASIASSSPAQASPPTPTAQSPPPPPAAPPSPPPPAAPPSPPPAAPPSPPPAAPSPPPSAPSPPAAPTPPPVPVPLEAASLPTPEETEELVTTVTIKRARKRSRISDNSSYSIIDSGTPTQLKEVTSSPNQHESVENTSNIQRRRRNVREDTSSTVSNIPSTSTSAFSTTTKDTSPSTSTPAISTTAKGASLSTSTTTTSAVSAREHTKASLPESSGDSEDEDGGVKVHRVSVEDLPKIPHLLVQIEGLKARQNKKDPDYQEMRELKEQIQMMRRQLEARMEDEDGRPDTPDSPKEEQQQQPSGAEIILQDTQEKPVSREYEQLQFDRTVRRLLAEGRAGSYEKAELAAQLLTFKFGEMDSLQAAEECSSIYTAIQFLQQECELCAEKYPMRKMVSMLQCTHRCCCDCAKTYFTFQIKTKNIREVRCPFCNEPDLDANEEMNDEYLNNMDILLKNILDAETHELFQRKLRDWTLMKDPNFRWCNKCSSGFISNPRARKLICPDCGEVTCAHCRVTWEGAHEGISCEAFARWKADNDMEVAVQGVAKHLAECGITCPKCKFTYSLAKGGCMHFTCTQCKHEFCSGCSQPFRQGSKCSVGPYCARLGLHAHHPRNCLFYLRDKEPQQLQNLLKEAGVSFDTEPVGEQEQQGGARPMCQVQEQKELPDGLKDDICGRVVPTGYAGLCRLHYTEYLVEKINTHKLDPVSIFDEADLRVCLRRNGKTVPIRRWESEKLYRDKLIKVSTPFSCSLASFSNSHLA